MMMRGASLFEVVAAPATPVTAARRPRESPPLLGVLLELVGGPRRRRVTCRAGVWEGSAARMARSSVRIEAKDGLHSRQEAQGEEQGQGQGEGQRQTACVMTRPGCGIHVSIGQQQQQQGPKHRGSATKTQYALQEAKPPAACSANVQAPELPVSLPAGLCQGLIGVRGGDGEPWPQALLHRPAAGTAGRVKAVNDHDTGVSCSQHAVAGQHMPAVGLLRHCSAGACETECLHANQTVDHMTMTRAGSSSAAASTQHSTAQLPHTLVIW